MGLTILRFQLLISCPIAFWVCLGEEGHCGVYYHFSSCYNQIFNKRQRLKWGRSCSDLWCQRRQSSQQGSHNRIYSIRGHHWGSSQLSRAGSRELSLKQGQTEPHKPHLRILLLPESPYAPKVWQTSKKHHHLGTKCPRR